MKNALLESGSRKCMVEWTMGVNEERGKAKKEPRRTSRVPPVLPTVATLILQGDV